MSPKKQPQPGESRARRSAPEPWASAMHAAGLTHNGKPSISALAARARRSTGTETPSLETTRRWLYGMRAGNIGPEVAQALAQALSLPVGTVLEWTGAAVREQTPWIPPPVSSRLTSDQRKALDQLVRLFALSNEREAGGPRGDTAPMNGAAMVEEEEVPRDGRLTREGGRRSRTDPQG